MSPRESVPVSRVQRTLLRVDQLSDCGFSASEEMQGEDHYSDYQQDVN
jgi:hypothetical protein